MTTDNQAKQSVFNLKKILIILVIVILLIISIIVSFTIVGRPYDRTNNSYKEVCISDGCTTEDIAQILYKKKIIGSKAGFIRLSSIWVHGDDYQPGTYYLSPAMPFRTIAETMLKGITTNNGFDIPAGYTVEQTAEALSQAGFVDKNEFRQIINTIDLGEFDFIDSNVKNINRVEGFLYPASYNCNDDASAAMVLITMLNEFDNIFTEEYRARAEELGMSIRDIVTIASMIEKETSFDNERADISSVIHNKINVDSEFDGGFPKGPLCSPGIESIKAALYPTDTTYIYYVLSDKLDGRHKFTSDMKEYKELSDAYKKAVKDRKENRKNEEA